MAIANHVAYILEMTESGERVKRVTGSGNADGEPLLADYIALEAADDFVVSVLDNHLVITVSAADLNGA